MLWFHFVSCVKTFSVLFGGYFIRLVLLLLGLTSAKSRPHVQLIRAELSSKGSSEPPSESLSKLSSHQIPRCIVSEGTTTAKGLYANSFFVLSHYAFGSVSAQCVLFALSTPLRLRGRTGGSAAARVLLACPSRASPSSASSRWAFLSYEAFPHAEVRRLRIHAPVVPLSLLLVLRLPSCARLCARCTCTGADGCAFPSATAGVFQYRIAYVFALARLFRGAFFYWGGQTCFLGRDCVRLQIHCCIALFC